MKEQTITYALGLERKRNGALLEVMELTGELAEAVRRQDQVSVRMFLGMRQEPINRLREYQALLRRTYRELPAEEAGQLRELLEGAGKAELPAAQSLARLAGQNRTLLERIVGMDRQMSLRVGGDKSFYSKRRGEG